MIDTCQLPQIKDDGSNNYMYVYNCGPTTCISAIHTLSCDALMLVSNVDLHSESVGGHHV